MTPRVALVTGASGGIGSACARALAAASHRVAVGYGASAGAADKVCEAITAAGGTALAVHADVTTKDSVDAAFATVEEASFSHGGVRSFDQHGHGAALRTISGRVWMERAYGDFWQHVLVAEGRLDFALEADVNLWDLAPVQLIVEEAGGRFTDFAGIVRPDGGSAVSSNGRLHDEVLAALAS